MKLLVRIAALAAVVLAAACARHDAGPTLEGRWRVQLRLEENWFKGRTPVRRMVSGELIFDRRIPDLPWYAGQDLYGPHVNGCVYLPVHALYDASNREPSAFDGAAGCGELMGHRSRGDSVWAGINASVIDAGTFLRGVARGDTVRGRWLTGSESLHQGGAGTFVMWRVSGTPAGFTGTLLRVQLARVNERWLAFASEYLFDPAPEAVPWMLGAFAVVVCAALAYAWKVTRGRWIALSVVVAAAIVEIAVLRGTAALIERLYRTYEPSPIAMGATAAAVTALMFIVIPVLAWAAVRRAARAPSTARPSSTAS